VPEGGDNWTNGEDGRQLREVREVKLYDISPVTYPAYPSTSVAMRSLFPGGVVPKVIRDILAGGDAPTGGSLIDVGAALAAVKKAMKVHSLLMPDPSDRIGLLGAHLVKAYKALGGQVDESGNLKDGTGGNDKTQLPSRSYRLQRMAHAEAEIMRSMPNSNAAKRLRCDWALEEIKSDQARANAIIEKDEHHERWRLKNPCVFLRAERTFTAEDWRRCPAARACKTG
jgi:hypothetical protein